MSIRIQKDCCIGCGKCAEVCPGTLIELNSASAEQALEHVARNRRIAHIAVPEDCWGCVSCVKVCPVQAIDFYLAEDLGGPNSEETTLQVQQEGSLLHWNFYKHGEPLRTITVDRRNSNQY